MTTWTLEGHLTATGILFNTLGIPFNSLPVIFGGSLVTTWTLQTLGE